MSNVHTSEPQAYGLITFKTNFGDIDIELFTKQCPKISRNFVQLCLDGYYNKTRFTRVEKDFIAVAGDDKDTEEYVPDEFHSRLRFSRRGLLATANTKKDQNGSAFFFTLGPTPELQNKHTIFGRVAGNTVFSLVDLNECHVDDDDLKPTSDKIINDVLVKENPFPELVPRVLAKLPKESTLSQEELSDSSSDDGYDPLAKKIDRSKMKKLSFFPNDDDDDEDDEDEDYEDSSENVAQPKEIDSSTNVEAVVQSTNSSQQHESPSTTHKESKETDQPHEDEPEKEMDQPHEEEPEKEELDAKEKRLREIRAQIQSIKEQIENESDIKKVAERRKKSNESLPSQDSSSSVRLEDSVDGIPLRIASKKSRNRERETIELVTNFKKKLKQVDFSSETTKTASNEIGDEFDLDELAALDKVSGDDWLQHKFDVDNEDEVRLAKDANTKDDSWYSVDDPRSSMNKRVSSRDRHRDESEKRHHRHHHHSSSRRRH